MLFSYSGCICIETVRFFLIYFFIVKNTIVLEACKGNLEQLDLNQQNETNSEVDDEDVEVEIEEDVEVVFSGFRWAIS